MNSIVYTGKIDKKSVSTDLNTCTKDIAIDLLLNIILTGQGEVHVYVYDNLSRLYFPDSGDHICYEHTGSVGIEYQTPQDWLRIISDD